MNWRKAFTMWVWVFLGTAVYDYLIYSVTGRGLMLFMSGFMVGLALVEAVDSYYGPIPRRKEHDTHAPIWDEMGTASTEAQEAALLRVVGRCPEPNDEGTDRCTKYAGHKGLHS